MITYTVVGTRVHRGAPWVKNNGSVFIRPDGRFKYPIPNTGYPTFATESPKLPSGFKNELVYEFCPLRGNYVTKTWSHSNPTFVCPVCGVQYELKYFAGKGNFHRIYVHPNDGWMELKNLVGPAQLREHQVAKRYLFSQAERNDDTRLLLLIVLASLSYAFRYNIESPNIQKVKVIAESTLPDPNILTFSTEEGEGPDKKPLKCTLAPTLFYTLLVDPDVASLTFKSEMAQVKSKAPNEEILDNYRGHDIRIEFNPPKKPTCYELFPKGLVERITHVNINETPLGYKDEDYGAPI